uniref:guanylate cyclase n=1 Tax=Caenorhabditis japonica TaxID=281687 RepID=A0A8R1HJ61_CAEJA
MNDGVEAPTDNYQRAMSGKVVATKYTTLTFDDGGSVLTDYGVYSANPYDMPFETIMTLKSSVKPCDTYNCFKLKMRKELENLDTAEGRTKEERDAIQEAMKLISKRRVFNAYALVAMQRAEFIAFKQLKKIAFTEITLDYLYKLKQLQNDNLAKFFGIQVNDLDNLTILHALVERGTLEEFCLDEEFNMNETFKSAFMRDIVKGLQYLHKSPIGYHGYLQAATCLIDINWVLKITLYGVSNFIAENYELGNIKNPDHSHPIITYEQYVCFPPEHIKEYDPSGTLPPRMVRGSEKGDIYNLGMIFFMMVENTEPYHKQVATDRQNLLKDILNNNKMPDSNPGNREEYNLMEFCKKCWNRDPAARPGLREILKNVNETYPGSTGNLVDQMIRMNEKNAENLEKAVAEKTAELAAAQQVSITLLNEMLPA